MSPKEFREGVAGIITTRLCTVLHLSAEMGAFIHPEVVRILTFHRVAEDAHQRFVDTAMIALAAARETRGATVDVDMIVAEAEALWRARETARG